MHFILVSSTQNAVNAPMKVSNFSVVETCFDKYIY